MNFLKPGILLDRECVLWNLHISSPPPQKKKKKKKKKNNNNNNKQTNKQNEW